MAQTIKALNTLNNVSVLLQKSYKTIMRREDTNENRVHLYGIGEYWAAFDKSAYLLETLTNDDCGATVLHLKDYPFPVLMYCMHYEKVKTLCSRHIMTKQGFEYLQFLTHPIDSDSYKKWYREYTIDED